MSHSSPLCILKKPIPVTTPPGHQDRWQVRSYAGADDVAIWLHIQNGAFRAVGRTRPWTAVHFTRELRGRPWWSPHRLWFATEADNTAVGSVALEVTSAAGQLHWLAVLPSHQRRGVGRRLLEVAEAACRRDKVDQLRAEVMTGGGAETFYRKHGFHDA